MSRRNVSVQSRGITISSSSEDLYSNNLKPKMAARDEDGTSQVGLDDDDSLPTIGNDTAVRWNEEQAWEEANKGTSSILPFVNAFFLTVATVLVRSFFGFSLLFHSFVISRLPPIISYLFQSESHRATHILAVS
jgi:hypothetical protein